MNLEKRNQDGLNTGASCTDNSPQALMSDYMINAYESNKLVYCRFGEKYI